jgi:hypothetical protein
MTPVIMTTTCVSWRDFRNDPPAYNGYHLLAMRDAAEPLSDELVVQEAQRVDGVWYQRNENDESALDTSDVILWADMPTPSAKPTPKQNGFSPAELWQAIVRGGFDLSLCRTCSKPVVCLPDGLSNVCEACVEAEQRKTART